MKERGEEMRVVDGERKFDEDVLVFQAALLETIASLVNLPIAMRMKRSILLDCELRVFVGSHECGR